MKDPQRTIIYGAAGIFGAVLLYQTWQYLVGGLALVGLWYLCSQNNNNRRPPRCR